MFKMIFKMAVMTLFLVFVTVALAMWKGGEPFRYFGGGVVVVGKAIVKFGDIVDEFISGGKQVHKSYERLKDVIHSDPEQEKDRER